MSYQMENLIIGLENEEKYGNNIGELFRIAHNIKSAASYFKIEPIQKLAVLLEEILEEAREISGPASKEFVDWALEVCDQFNKYKEDLDDDADDFSEFNSKIMRIPTNLEK
jgi:two-component system chemotaxis sensor kinase CheA